MKLYLSCLSILLSIAASLTAMESDSSESTVDFEHNELVTFQAYDASKQNGLAEPQLGHIIKDNDPAVDNYFKEHNLPYYKVLVASLHEKNEPKNYYRFIRSDHVRKVPLEKYEFRRYIFIP